MKGWLRHHLHALARAVSQSLGHPLASLLTAVVIGIALALPAGGLLLLDNAGRAIGNEGGRPEISVFLTPAAGKREADEVARRLAVHREISDVRFVPRDAALARLAANGLEDVIQDLPSNPLPDAFVLHVAGDDPALFEALQATIATWPAVEHVQLDSAWVKRVHALIDLGRETVLLLAALLAAALVIVTFNTIRLQLLTQRAEIEVSRLLGATDHFIRRPFLWLGAIQGLLGGLVAWLLVAGMVTALREPVATLAQSYGTVFALQHASAPQVLALLGVAMLLGLGGAQLSVDRHLRDAR